MYESNRGEFRPWCMYKPKIIVSYFMMRIIYTGTVNKWKIYYERFNKLSLDTDLDTVAEFYYLYSDRVTML